MKDHPFTKEELRQKAIELYKMNWTVSAICSTLGCSRGWFYKWLKRYNEHDATWFQDESRVPHNIPNKIDPALEQMIIQTRKELKASPYSQYGPQAIYFAMAQKRYTPPPIWTIARTLKRHGMVKHEPRGKYVSKGKTYPYVYCLCHQMDFVGPRYLSCKARYYFLSLIDCDCHWCQTTVLENRRASSVNDCLVRFWKIIGIPDFLQMDNELCFWGSLKNPRAVGKVIRLCLLHRITPVFIPHSEPWRNGVVECFNKTMQKNILNDQHSSLDHLKKAATYYDHIHNETHHYSSQEGKTPKQACKHLGYPLQRLEQSYEIPRGKLPLENGEIHVIRFIRKDRKFNVFGLSFTLPEKVINEYVKGIILTDEHRLIIFRDWEYIIDFQFVLYS